LKLSLNENWIINTKKRDEIINIFSLNFIFKITTPKKNIILKMIEVLSQLKIIEEKTAGIKNKYNFLFFKRIKRINKIGKILNKKEPIFSSSRKKLLTLNGLSNLNPKILYPEKY